ncbi:biotin-independent malonate decarboxylase subunit beta [uncultured Ilyobacter sp.]|uniref:biotin-independent malonate decarboxylase subunit beta n=1 Tax=uncultured Ilyobacter sp. TaxID=544433 RepID=UPI0029C0E511|nr:biotin-independent malonate decarboxylase subunit beta [uncultured Ilyobacter sp.]
MALEYLEFEYLNENFKSIPVVTSHTGVVGSGDMEVLMTRKDQEGKVLVKVSTPVKGFENVWNMVLQKFVKESKLGNVLIEINDNNSTPFIVSLRMKQAFIEAMSGNNNSDNYEDIQDQSFYEATSRVRARNIVDEGTFSELAGPTCKLMSPHLPVLGQATAFDDGVVTGIGKIGERPAFVISQEGKFIGGAVGEVSGAKIVNIFNLASDLYKKIVSKYPKDYEKRVPLIIWSFETGGVRLHEANAGLLAHAEVMEAIQKCRGSVPIISLVGSKVGCFGGMGFVTVATDCIIMSELGRIGLTGPEVIEQEMGKEEFDSADKSLIYRTTGGKHKYIMRDCSFLVKDSIGDFKRKIEDLSKLSYEEIQQYRSIGSLDLVNEQMNLVKLVSTLKPKDSKDMWNYYGNLADKISDDSYEEFIVSVKRRKRGVFDL